MTPNHVEFTEREFAIHRGGRKILVGHPDSVLVFQDRPIVAVRERKFGFKRVTDADANLQLRAYLVLVASEFPADAYFGCLVQPRISSRPCIVQYTPADIVKARAEIEAIYDACYGEDPPRHASNEACEFCTAKALCPEFAQWTSAVVKAQHLPVAAWTDEQMDVFLSRRGILEKFLKDTLEQIKQIKLANPERIPQWRLKDGASVRTVTDLVRAWSALQSHMSATEFSGECDVSIGGLEKVIWQKHQDDPSLGKLTQKGVKALVNDLLKDVLSVKRNRPSLEKE